MWFVRAICATMVLAGIYFGATSSGEIVDPMGWTRPELLPGRLAMGIVCVSMGGLLMIPTLIYEFTKMARKAPPGLDLKKQPTTTGWE